jgi:pyridoxal/pyridoxine/pyridoxamine kinase
LAVKGRGQRDRVGSFLVQSGDGPARSFPQIDAVLSGYQGGVGIGDVITDAVGRVSAPDRQGAGDLRTA